jgi:hypothetical protein
VLMRGGKQSRGERIHRVCRLTRRMLGHKVVALSGRTYMNVFTTDHPLASQSSWFDQSEHPLLSFVCCTCALALILTPLVLARLYYYAIADIGAEPNPFPDFWGALFMGSVLAFAVSLVCAVPVVLGFRLVARNRRKRCARSHNAARLVRRNFEWRHGRAYP